MVSYRSPILHIHLTIFKKNIQERRRQKPGKNEGKLDKSARCAYDGEAAFPLRSGGLGKRIE
jgi:hypothetical protein